MGAAGRPRCEAVRTGSQGLFGSLLPSTFSGYPLIPLRWRVGAEKRGGWSCFRYEVVGLCLTIDVCSLSLLPLKHPGAALFPWPRQKEATDQNERTAIHAGVTETVNRSEQPINPKHHLNQRPRYTTPVLDSAVRKCRRLSEAGRTAAAAVADRYHRRRRRGGGGDGGLEGGDDGADAAAGVPSSSSPSSSSSSSSDVTTSPSDSRDDGGRHPEGGGGGADLSDTPRPPTG